mmetsp:Transcript_23995/g.60235  ORF Transcript_23995/g.60235 Transcript_23995/m.60235 type:complete len:223 (+) Transcript_23995:3446-4114(+)
MGKLLSPRLRFFSVSAAWSLFFKTNRSMVSWRIFRQGQSGCSSNPLCITWRRKGRSDSTRCKSSTLQAVRASMDDEKARFESNVGSKKLVYMVFFWTIACAPASDWWSCWSSPVPPAAVSMACCVAVCASQSPLSLLILVTIPSFLLLTSHIPVANATGSNPMRVYWTLCLVDVSCMKLAASREATTHDDPARCVTHPRTPPLSILIRWSCQGSRARCARKT